MSQTQGFVQNFDAAMDGWFRYGLIVAGAMAAAHWFFGPSVSKLLRRQVENHGEGRAWWVIFVGFVTAVGGFLVFADREMSVAATLALVLGVAVGVEGWKCLRAMDG